MNYKVEQNEKNRKGIAVFSRRFRDFSVKKNKCCHKVAPLLSRRQIRPRNKFMAEQRESFKIISRKNYALSDGSRTAGMSPVGGVARILMSSWLAKKNKTAEVRP